MVTVLILTIVLIGSGVSLGQESTGTLYGKVTDEGGGALPGATVTVTSPSLMGTEVRVTSPQGTYRVPSLPPGTYTVSVEMSGFRTVNREAIILTAGAVLGIDVMLGLSPVEETITVIGESPLIDVKSTQLNRTIENALIENIPTRRAVADILITAPGILDGEYGYTPAQVVHGSTVRDNVYNVDGANVNDGTNGYMMTDLPYDMLEEVQITSGGISAEYGQASGAVFNFITKSGGNEFSGDGSFYLESDGLSASNVTDELREQGLRRGTEITRNLEYGASLGGPIQRDKIWFFGNFRSLKLDQVNPDFDAQDIGTDQFQSYVKLTAQLPSDIQLQGSYTRRTLNKFPGNGSFRTNDAPETWSTSWRNYDIFSVGATWVVNESTFVEGRFSQSFWNGGDQANPQRHFPNTPFQIGYREITTGLNFGGWTGTSTETNKRDVRTFKGTLTHYRENMGGSHNLTVGAENYFSPFLWTRFGPDDMNALQLRNGQPHRVQLRNTPVGEGTNITRIAAFAQDEWTLNDRVTINLGLRAEWTEGWLPEQQGGGGRWSEVVVFEERRNAIDWFNVVPRLGLVWDLKGDGQTSIKASYARYLTQLITTNLLAANTNKSNTFTYDWVDLNGDLRFQDGEQGTLRNVSQASKNFFDENLGQAHVDAFNIGFEHQIANNVVLSVTGIFKFDRNIMENVDVGVPFSAYIPIEVTNPVDGQTLTIFAQDTATIGENARMLTNPSDPLRLLRDYRGVEFVLRKRFSDGWQLQGSLNLGKTTGSINNSFNASQGGRDIYNNPNTLINVDENAPLDLDAPVQLKLQGSYMAPYDIMLSAYYQGISGFPIKRPDTWFSDIPGTYTVRFSQADNPLIQVENFISVAGVRQGTHRFDWRNLMAVRVEKQIPLRGSARLGLMVDVFNVFNISTVTAVQSLIFDHSNFLKPARIEKPLGARLGVRFTF